MDGARPGSRALKPRERTRSISLFALREAKQGHYPAARHWLDQLSPALAWPAPCSVAWNDYGQGNVDQACAGGSPRTTALGPLRLTAFGRPHGRGDRGRPTCRRRRASFNRWQRWRSSKASLRRASCAARPGHARPGHDGTTSCCRPRPQGQAIELPVHDTQRHRQHAWRGRGAARGPQGPLFQHLPVHSHPSGATSGWLIGRIEESLRTTTPTRCSPSRSQQPQPTSRKRDCSGGTRRCRPRCRRRYAPRQGPAGRCRCAKVAITAWTLSRGRGPPAAPPLPAGQTRDHWRLYCPTGSPSSGWPTTPRWARLSPRQLEVLSRRQPLVLNSRLGRSGASSWDHRPGTHRFQVGEDGP